MASDRRKKGCPNEPCEVHIKKVMQKSEINYCPKCGTKLNYVCIKCFREIENTDKKHRTCYLCEAELVEKRSQRIEQAKEATVKAGKAVMAVAAPVVATIAKKVIDEGQDGAVKVGVKVVKDSAKAVVEKIIKK